LAFGRLTGNHRNGPHEGAPKIIRPGQGRPAPMTPRRDRSNTSRLTTRSGAHHAAPAHYGLRTAAGTRFARQCGLGAARIARELYSRRRPGRRGVPHGRLALASALSRPRVTSS
jgi:hypothetical protein